MFSREDFEFYKGFTGGHVEKHQWSYFEGENNVSKRGNKFNTGNATRSNELSSLSVNTETH